MKYLIILFSALLLFSCSEDKPQSGSEYRASDMDAKTENPKAVKKQKKGFLAKAKEYKKAKNYELAIEYFTKYINASPKDPKGYMSRLGMYQKTKKFDKALNDANKFVELAPEDPRAYMQRGNINARLKNKGMAIKDFQKVLELIKDNDKYSKFYDRAAKKLAKYENKKAQKN